MRQQKKVKLLENNPKERDYRLSKQKGRLGGRGRQLRKKSVAADRLAASYREKAKFLFCH